MTKKEFEQLCKRIIPHIEAIETELKRAGVDNIIDLTVAADGYTHMIDCGDKSGDGQYRLIKFSGDSGYAIEERTPMSI